MTYPAGTDLATSFQDGQAAAAQQRAPHLQPHRRVLLRHRRNGTRGAVNTIPQQNGDAALLFSGEAIDLEPSAASSAVLPASGIWVSPVRRCRTGSTPRPAPDR